MPLATAQFLQKSFRTRSGLCCGINFCLQSYRQPLALLKKIRDPSSPTLQLPTGTFRQVGSRLVRRVEIRAGSTLINKNSRNHYATYFSYLFPPSFLTLSRPFHKKLSISTFPESFSCLTISTVSWWVQTLRPIDLWACRFKRSKSSVSMSSSE